MFPPRARIKGRIMFHKRSRNFLVSVFTRIALLHYINGNIIVIIGIMLSCAAHVSRTMAGAPRNPYVVAVAVAGWPVNTVLDVPKTTVYKYTVKTHAAGLSRIPPLLYPNISTRPPPSKPADLTRFTTLFLSLFHRCVRVTRG